MIEGGIEGVLILSDGDENLEGFGALQVTEHIADTFETLIAFPCSREFDASVKIPVQVVELSENQR
ncbi:hypothetical protein [Bradyrhizobium sp. 195]|uniref:hypothetical protein n=1 Tax=Bradyrhizobium sp. 195 TaxID=2782662 RepID=UPI002000D1A0|nr:hypothetical protein [Bradyrhizobium sp. 195]UPK31235.1 hypothetical protein IVB26_39515 [Bradyrhizobium sp. 195]